MAYIKSEYDKEYAKQHITRKFIPFNDTVPEDVELLKWLDLKRNVTQYIKQLIRDDMDNKPGVWNFFEEPDGYYHYECSLCEEWLCPGDWNTDTKPYAAGFKFCPYCGGKMSDS